MWKPQNNTSGFSIIVAILVSAFLIILSMGVLDLILGEQRNTRIIYNTISGYAGAEGSLELTLLKVKNHQEGFQETIGFSDSDANILGKNRTKANIREQKIASTIQARANSFSGQALSGEFVIIPLFYDNETGVTHDTSSENVKTEGLKVDISDDVVWNIIGNNSEGATIGLVGKGQISSATKGEQKTSSDQDEQINYKEGGVEVSDFMTNHKNNYLILFSNLPFSFHIEATNDFSLPKTDIVASSQIGDFVQNISFTEDKSRLFDALKYSVFSEDTP